MKLAAGKTYREAITMRPYAGINKNDLERINTIRENMPVVIDYKKLKKGEKYLWKRHGPFCYYIIEKATGEAIREKSSSRSSKGEMKIKYFKSISRAKEWMYEKDKDYYNSLSNLTVMCIASEESIKK